MATEGAAPWETSEPPAGPPSERVFRCLGDDRYVLDIPELALSLEIDRLRRERHQLIGELVVKCDLAGASTVDGTLSIAEMNLSSVRARQDRARYLASRARTKSSEVDFLGLLEELAQRVLAAERKGDPAVDLRSLPRPKLDDMLEVDGLSFPRRHPSIVFGDGGAAKSYLLLYFLGCLAKRGIRVALFDWELDGADHRLRLERLFGDAMPEITYVRCERPLVSEMDRLRRIVRERKIEFAGYDSISFACDGPPEAADVASQYIRAARQIGVGGVHNAHQTKSVGGDQKPFGSVFWHNGARAVWYAKLADATPDRGLIQLGLFHRKINLDALHSPVGFEISFADGETRFRRTNVADIPDLAAKLSVQQRMIFALQRGAMTPEALAKDIEAQAETVKRTARRYREQFVVLNGGYLGLKQRGT